jgi:dTDP-glucose pyrophosphorylase
MNILIPMVMTNSEIESNGKFSKFLYEINRKPLISYAIDKLAHLDNSKLIFIIHSRDVKLYHLDRVIKLLLPDSLVIVSEGDTKGAACSALLAIDYIDNDDSLIITGADQIIESDLRAAIRHFNQHKYDGGTVIFDDVHPRWSFVKVDANGLVTEAAEKYPISKNACTGFFYYKKGVFFVEAAKQMILKGADVNGQYYVCPVFNEMVLDGKRIGTYNIEKKDYFSLTTTKGIEAFEKHISA